MANQNGVPTTSIPELTGDVAEFLANGEVDGRSDTARVAYEAVAAQLRNTGAVADALDGLAASIGAIGGDPVAVEEAFAGKADVSGSNVSGADATAFRDDALKALPRAGLAAAKDAADFTALDADDDVLAIFLQKAEYDLGAAVPTKRVWGPGSVKLNDITIDELVLTVDVARANIMMRPPRYHPLVTGDDLAAVDLSNNDFDSIYLAPGAARSRPMVPDGNGGWKQGRAARDVVIGAGSATLLEDSERLAINGQANFARARYGDRWSLVATSSAMVLGQDPRNDPTARYFESTVFYNDGNPLFVSLEDHTIRPEWDKGNMRVHRPDVLDGSGNLVGGITYELKRFFEANLWAKTKADVSIGSGVGRDIFGQMWVGNNQAGVGYRAGALGQRNFNRALLGDFANENGAFVNDIASVGTYSLQYYQGGAYDDPGTGADVSGTYAARNLITGKRFSIHGDRAGYSYNQDTGTPQPWHGSGNVFLGPDAGRSLDGTIDDIDDVGFIQNDYRRHPFVTIEFDTKRGGINLPKRNADLSRRRALGRWHIRGGDALTALDANDNHLLVLENDGNAFTRVAIPNTAAFWQYVGDPESLVVGGWGYDHATNIFSIVANGASKIAAGPNGVGFNGKSNITPQTWGTFTGSASRAGFDVSTVTLPVLAAHLLGVLNDMKSLGLRN